MEILFSKSINDSSKDKFISDVINICNLNGLKSDPSAEGGFNLPLTSEWFNIDLTNKHCLKYHDSRQLRFVKNHVANKIIGLRYKDDINYWTNDEILMLKESIELILLNYDN
jgi:hypothetical protein